MKKRRVVLLFGGKSAEHEVSLQSAKNVYEALNPNIFEVVLVGIDKSGRWLLQDSSQFLLHQEDPQLIQLNKSGSDVALAPNADGQASLIQPSGDGDGESFDVVFPILHGSYGEDGTIQGLLKLMNIPFVGAPVLGSAVGMDKDVMKRLLRDAGVRVAKFIVLRNGESVTFEEVKNALGLPFFVKPANLGSSVGVSKVREAEGFDEAVSLAFAYDTKILFEEFIEGREIECSVLGNADPIASVPGEIVLHHDFYSYETKYVDEKGAELVIPAKVTEREKKCIQDVAIKTFKVLECGGMARVDLFLKNDGTLYVNEINTIPGFTRISMYPKLWEVSGIAYSELCEKLIELAIERHKMESSLKTSRV